jgi:hypothetical protein
LWHGNIALAVKVLQRTIKANKAMAVTNSSEAHKDEDLYEEQEDAMGERFIDELTPGHPSPSVPMRFTSARLHSALVFGGDVPRWLRESIFQPSAD